MEVTERAVSKRYPKAPEAAGRTCGWSIPGSQASFTMPAMLLNLLKAHVMTGYLSLPKRGAEVGGILLGRVLRSDPLTVHITGFEPVACEYRFGPAFVLSDSDRAALARQITTLTAREELSILGYFRSCTGREIALDTADEELLRTHFPAPATCVLSIKPLSFGHSEACFFFRRDGVISTLPTHPPLPFDDKQILTPSIPAEPEPQEPPAPTPVPAALPEPLHSAQPAAPPSRRPAWQWFSLAAAVALAVLAGSRYASPDPQPTPPPAAETEVIRHAPPPIPTQAAVIEQQAPAPTTEPPQPPPPIVAPQPPVAASPAELLRPSHPTVPPGIRARIESPITIDVEVRISRTGRVTRATAPDSADSLHRYLAERAVAAARSARFRPARDAASSPVASVRTLSFTFQPPKS